MVFITIYFQVILHFLYHCPALLVTLSTHDILSMSHFENFKFSFLG